MESKSGDRVREVHNLAAHSIHLLSSMREPTCRVSFQTRSSASTMLFLHVCGESMKGMYDGSTLFHADGKQLAWRIGHNWLRRLRPSLALNFQLPASRPCDLVLYIHLLPRSFSLHLFPVPCFSSVNSRCNQLTPPYNHLKTWASMSSADSLNLDSQDSYTLSNTPAIQPPPGVEPNFVNPASNRQPLIVVASLFLGLTSIFALTRAYVKTFIIRKYSWDDCELIHTHLWKLIV